MTLKGILSIAIVFSGMLMQAQFRNTTWGMSQAEVKQSESLEIVESSDDAVAYETLFLWRDAYIIYRFEHGKLTSGEYLFNNKYANNNDFIGDYHSINELLIEKYGEPISNKVNWKNDRWKNDKDYWGDAISYGHLEYESTFITDSIFIIHVLSGDEYPVYHVIGYSDPESMIRILKEDLDKL